MAEPIRFGRLILETYIGAATLTPTSLCLELIQGSNLGTCKKVKLVALFVMIYYGYWVHD